tara:strand:- start:1890 stop:2087 length:198 start_codon:yes stop_codon:yes gene_type:complete
VTDKSGLSASLAAFTITVTNTNDAPTITGTATTTAAQGTNYSSTPAATKIDVFSKQPKGVWLIST